VKFTNSLLKHSASFRSSVCCFIHIFHCGECSLTIERVTQSMYSIFRIGDSAYVVALRWSYRNIWWNFAFVIDGTLLTTVDILKTWCLLYGYTYLPTNIQFKLLFSGFWHWVFWYVVTTAYDVHTASIIYPPTTGNTPHHRENLRNIYTLNFSFSFFSVLWAMVFN
jgi:hypothetical protein